MRYWKWVPVLLALVFLVQGCKKTVEEQMENAAKVKNIKVDGKAAKLMTTYYPGTKIRAGRMTIVGKKPHGKAEQWHKNGKLKVVQYWKMGMRVGTWIFYKKDGTELERVDYDAMIKKEKEQMMKKKGGEVIEPEPRVR